MRKLFWRSHVKTSNLIIAGVLLVGISLLVEQQVNTDNRSRAQDIQPVVATPTSGIEKFVGQINPAIPGIPAYPGALVEYSYIKHDGPRTGYEIKWQSRDSVVTILQWYIGALPQEGWTLTKVPETLATITPPGPQTSVEYMLVAQNGNTQVRLIVNNEENELYSEISAEFPVK